MSSLDEALDGDGFFRSLIESSLDCVKVIDLEGLVRFVNQNALTQLEVDAADEVGRLWTSLWPAEQRAIVADALAVAQRGESCRFTAPRPTSSGIVKTWDVLVSPIRDNAGLHLGILTTSRDVTKEWLARREAAARELQLKRTAAALRSAATTVKIGGWEVDFGTNQVSFSDELWELLGAPIQPPMPLDIGVSRLLEPHRAPFAEALDRARALGERLHFEGQIDLISGRRAWLRMVGEPEMVDGVCVALRGVTQDVTDEKASLARLEASESQARAANAAKSDFLAVMSHEIRTPLNGVLGMAQAMAADDLSDVQRDRLELIRQSGRALLLLLNDLLDLSKIEAGKLVLEDGIVDVDELMGSAKATLSALIRDKDIGAEVTLAAAAKGCWRGDPARVQQVLLNLVSNAAKFTTRGSVRVEIGHAGDNLILKVSDTGPGIAADQQAQLFERFVQADASTTRRFGGSGLGLAICREIVSLMGGRIELDSVVGSGSTFSVFLPLTPVSRPEPFAVATVTSAAPDAALRILAAEDNDVNQLVLKTLLGQVGIEPHIVENGALALQAWEEAEWDLILMDVRMPEMDGPTAARRIRQREKATGRRRTPIIALTANAMAHHAAEYAAAGMDALVPKPIDFARLLQSMEDQLAAGDDDKPSQSAAA